MEKIPSLAKMFLSFLRLGVGAFGGPAMVVYIKELFIKHNKWLDEETFKDGVGLCQSIPGSTAMQMAAYVGLKTRGLPGAILSYIGFGLPAFSLMLIFSSLYLSFHNLRYVLSLFSGLQVIVIAIIVNATHLFGREVLKDYRDLFITITSAVLLFMGVSPFLVIAGAALTGIVVFRNIQRAEYRCTRTVGSFHVKQIVILLIILATSLFALYSVDKGLFKLAAVMMKINLFAFGGGFASLPLMLHEFVNTRGGLDNKIFMDGIALGQVTPGPIIITATFVGFWLRGLVGVIVTTIAIFTPSFFVLLAITPFFDRLKASVYFHRAMRGILVTFVGLLLYVAIKFALTVPWDAIRIIIGFAALILLLRKVDILYVVLIGAFISLLII